jgi:hydroxymethylpyrimidine/phosphomethylpyrimidine kinase
MQWREPVTARILIIAGSDSGGGAGIQADIKTVTMLGGHAMTAVTAITAQNTLGVTAVHPIPTDMVIAQMDAVISDIGVDAIKIGMIGSAETANAVADYLTALTVPIVFDPVMVATSGSILADAQTINAFERLMRLATLTTPNLPELAALGSEAAMVGPTLIKGGHAAGDIIIDRLIDGGAEVARWDGNRINTTSTHGTGCTLASAIACGLGQGLSLTDAIERARAFVRAALIAAPGLGKGHGPMGHQAVRDL